MAVLRCEKFIGMTDLPNYGREVGWLQQCDNYRVMPGGYLQSRGGFDKIKPSGGTASDPLAAGIFTGAHQHSRPDAYIVRKLGATYSNDLSQFAYWDIWPTTAAQNDALYIGADDWVSRVVFNIGQGTAGGTAPTYAYEVATAADWSTTATITPTTSPAFFTPGEQTLEIPFPSTGVASVVNGIYAKWIRIRQSNTGTVTVKVTQTAQKVYADGPGSRPIWITGADATAGTASGVLKFYGQSSATAVSWTSVSAALFSGNYAPHRFTSYKNVLYIVNGKEQKRYSGAAYNSAAYDTHALNDMGFTKPAASVFTATANVAGSGITGTYKYAITYGYGPAGEWGESNELVSASVPTPADDSVDLAWTLTGLPDPGIVDRIYVYRTVDLASMPTSAYASAPYYRMATITRNADGTMPATYTDNTQAVPFPPVALDITVNAPPTRCKFITTHKNRIFLGGNNQYPGRVWWSEPFEAEAFDTDEDFADFTRSTGGQLTGMVEFNDQVVCFTEDQMYGVANVDQDQPSIYVIHPGIGCVAPDSIAVAYGVMVWMARDGVYIWDGQSPVSRISDDMTLTFGKMSLEGHGRSRAVFYDRMYHVRRITAALSGVDSNGIWERYDLVTKSWSRVAPATGNLGVRQAPLATVLAPAGHGDAGVRHPLVGACITGGTNYAAYLYDWTTQDDAANYTCIATVHFGPKGWVRFIKARAILYCWPSGFTATLADSGSQLGYDNTGVFAATGDGAQDYTTYPYNYNQRGRGSQDIKVQINAVSAASQTLGGHKVYALYLEGTPVNPEAAS